MTGDVEGLRVVGGSPVDGQAEIAQHRAEVTGRSGTGLGRRRLTGVVHQFGSGELLGELSRLVLGLVLEEATGVVGRPPEQLWARRRPVRRDDPAQHLELAGVGGHRVGETRKCRAVGAKQVCCLDEVALRLT